MLAIKRAYEKLKLEGKILKAYNINGNNLYIRYLPKNENELYLLRSNPNIELSTYPLQENDVNNIATHHYDDGTLADDQISFQYSVCGIGQIIPNFETDILDTLFLNHINPTVDDDDWKKIEAEALVATGNLNTNDVQAFIFCSHWYPGGKIEIWDDAKGIIPLKKAKVKASKWYHVETAETSGGGYFQMSRMCGDVRYSIEWENGIWDIRDGKLKQAVTDGPKKKGLWTHLIKDDKKSLGFGTVHRSLVRYFFEDVAGLRRPFPGAQYLKVSYRHESGDSNGYFSSSGFEGLFASHVHIFGFNGSTLRQTQSIFSTTSHELAHVAHAFQIGNIQFWQVSNLIVESWARACQWKITELEYGNSPSPVPGSMQGWSFSSSAGSGNNYNPLFVDLEDNFNQNSSNPSLPNDVVSGYTLSLIQSNVLSDSYGLTSLRNRLKSQKPIGVTDAQIDTNLLYYFNNF
jgi:hypothetical protein